MLLVGLVLVQAAGLTIHALDRIDLQRLAQARDLALRVVMASTAMWQLTDARHRGRRCSLRCITALACQATLSDAPAGRPDLPRNAAAASNGCCAST